MILSFPHKKHINVIGAPRSETSTLTGQRVITAGSISPSLTVRCTPSEKVFMALHLMSAVWRLTIPSHEKFLLLALADHAKDDGACWPGIPLLASKCSLSHRQVQRILKRLETRGFIKRDFRHGHSTLYRVVVTGISPSAKKGVTLMSLSPVVDVITDGDTHVTQNLKLNRQRTLGNISGKKEELVISPETQEILDRLYGGKWVSQ